MQDQTLHRDKAQPRKNLILIFLIYQYRQRNKQNAIQKRKAIQYLKKFSSS